ncbi:hypothetical protein Ga0080559_TMP191 (plasmid) [Salipiger profundus]|uniref:Uncharacterized protein n=1 Tax=Salipiger profundus TaxID=1229727 RepID=A0A1U7DDB4_9RHOB|nr:hypothetical protein Ga0080559_TMP191 [Salipiger profundus]
MTGLFVTAGQVGDYIGAPAQPGGPGKVLPGAVAQSALVEKM